ncbi:uncharacterized protein LOC115445636 [Manduca sexta]|uniref:uncharacterized protein LOC115445636 n=1 Tax=Manduca sexta TaxID=7130 RepID=UPI0011841B59|nr:uncharacterized protein LOC115445636 [Manduca sexta]
MNIFKLNALGTLIGAPGSGRSGRKGPVKKTGKPLEKFGATSEESYFLGKQKEQLEKLKKELKKKTSLMSRKEEKQMQVMKNLTKKRGKKSTVSKKKKTVKSILGFVTKTTTDNRNKPEVPKDN